MSSIRRLSPHIINQIAAGEVIERPASVIKELVENALDAKATDISITIDEGGKTLMSVQDNGLGIEKADLSLAVERHATSKLSSDDLFAIHTLGFRGEALPSIGAVSRLSIKSSRGGEGWHIRVEGGKIYDPIPSPVSQGTYVEVRDLFYAIPARLHFLKATVTETQHIVRLIERFAILHPHVHFRLKNLQKSILDYPPGTQVIRLNSLFGETFSDNSLTLSIQKDGLGIHGHISLPTFNRANTQYQLFSVNGRLVKDRGLLQAIRLAYQDFLAHDRYPICYVDLRLDARHVDVNVHPAKTEVRFKDPQRIYTGVRRALKETLAAMGHKTADTPAKVAIKAFSPSSMRSHIQQPQIVSPQNQNLINTPPSTKVVSDSEEKVSEVISYPLGTACAHIHENYIVSQTSEGLIIIDQHAAHERILYEQLKAEQEVKRQALLMPEVIECTEEERHVLMDNSQRLLSWGIAIEPFGPKGVLVRETPAILGTLSPSTLLRDVLDDLMETQDASLLQQRIYARYSTQACHKSIRKGKKLGVTEMNELLRQMERTPSSGQCNHGRPTYIHLNLTDIEKLFGRR